MVKSRKAWVAVTEAVLGIVILFTFVMISLGNQQKQQENNFNFNSLFIHEIENNQTLRDSVLSGNENSVNISLNKFISNFNQNYNLDVCIRAIDGVCSSNIQGKEVIAIDYFVAANSINFEPKKLRIFLWRKD
jgi:hypothetical protein